MRSLLLTIAALFGLITFSCISDDITDAPSAKLSFSVDTLSFDTVFTNVGTPTARLVVYNNNDKGVNISEIRFSDPDGNFFLNVDGQSGKIFHDIEIRANDSILVFVECFPPESQSSKPHLIEEKLLFLTNGNAQTIPVLAWGQNVTRLSSLRVKNDMTLSDDQPYIVFDSLVVEKNATLNILPGTQLLFHDKASLRVHGTIKAIGTPQKKIDIRGDRIDNVLPDVSFDILAGQWEGISIAPESFDNHLEYVNMRSTVSGLTLDSCQYSEKTKLTLVNSWLHNSQQNVLSAKMANINAIGCVFSEAPEAVVSLTGGNHLFLQCTFANNYLFSAILQPLVCLYYTDPENNGGAPQNAPFMQASFQNSIIYGLGQDINIGNLDNTRIYLKNVLLKANGSDDQHFINCIWGKDPLFLTVRNDYYFNYHLQEDSPAINAGNPAFLTSPQSLYDMDGNYRLRNGNPALGAYVFTPQN